ncbi:MAG: hypothetical protein ACYCPS_00590 [Candidatus Saccharimonadales bacterium]
MGTTLAVVAVSFSSLFNAIAPILQKVGADKEVRPKRIDVTLLARLFKNPAYVLGTISEVASFILSLVALRVLPLFLVQSIFAGSVIVTVLIEKIIYRQKLKALIYISISVILLGMLLVSLAAEASRTSFVNSDIRIAIDVAPVILIVFILLASLLSSRYKGITKALIAGLGFGGTSLIGRIMIYPSPFWHVLYNPMMGALIVYGLLGQYEMMVALQNTSSTTTNALLILTGTILPAILGLVVFNDVVRSGFFPIIAVGIFLIVVGSLLIVKYDPYIPRNVKL